MSYGTEGLSASDVALLTGNGTNNGFGDGAGWWIIIFLIFALGGFGGRGFGGFGNGSGIGENYVLATDFATIERKLDSLANGICDSTFALNNTMTNGFAGVQQTLCQGFNGINTSILQSANATERGFATLGNQLAMCCCDIEKGIMGVNYNLAQTGCNITNAISMSTRDIIDNQNCNYRALHDEIVANRIEDKNAQIAAQQNEINALRLAASQAKQNEYLVDRLGTKCPEAAYIVPNPNCCYNYAINGVGYGNSGCGCSL